MARSSRDAYAFKLKQAKIDYVFRAYVRQDGTDSWPTRHKLISRLANECGDHWAWSETVFVGPDQAKQEWIVWAFREFEHKAKFEAGVAAITSMDFVLPDHQPLKMGENWNK